MFKKLFSAIGIKDYLIGIIINSLRLRNGIFYCVFIWFFLFSIGYVDYIVTKGSNQSSAISIFAGVFTIVFFFFAGYVLYLVFDFIPKEFILKRILPIREKLDEVLSNSKIEEHSFTEPNDIEKIEKIIKLERIPSDTVLEIWLYKLKMQRNYYILISPLTYFMLLDLKLLIQTIPIPFIINLISNIENSLKSPPLFIEILKWAFIVFVITNETLNINTDINRIELLKGIKKKNISSKI